MMYRRPIAQPAAAPRRRRLRPAPVALSVALMAVVGGACGFIRAGHRHVSATAMAAQVSHSPKVEYVERTRLAEDCIPVINPNTIQYGQEFNDINDTQLVVARKNGLRHPELVTDPTLSDELLPIVTNDLYVVDSMTFSKPFLVPDAVMLLQYIGLRFQELSHAYKPEHHYRFIVTSALRSQDDVERLRRRNRNATETSCHCYGTTIDITYMRFRDENGDDVDDLMLKNLVAQTLAELRYEGLCYVKYERRQACFHLTLRNPEYVGSQPSVQKQYITPNDWAKVTATHKKATIATRLKRAVAPQKTQSATTNSNYIQY